jgi:Flp pilus assembly CpaE family ATPase
VVVNRFSSTDIVTASDAKDALGREVFWKVQNDYKAFTNALTRGRPVTDKDDSPLARSYIQLAAKLGGTSQTTPVEPTESVAASGSRFGRLLRMGKRN